MISASLGCIIGGYSGGKLCDIFSIKPITYIGHCIFIFNCIFSIVVSLIHIFPLSCFACFMWGFGLLYTQSN